MSEIININVGKAGLKIGQKFLQNIAKEHFHDKQESRGQFNVFFHQTPQQNHESRSLFFDLHLNTVQTINCQNENYTIPQNNLFKGSGILSDLFATGFCCESYQDERIIFDKVRKQVQKSDRLSGFLIINSIGGGTGGGMTSKILMKLRQEYPSSIIQDHVVMPEFNSICSPLHIYNSVLSINPVIENTDLCFLAQNSAFDQRLLLEGNFRPSLDEINAVHAQNICQTTAPYRFNGNLNTSQRKICVNMVMFPRMKFLISSFSNKNVKLKHIEDAFNSRNYSKRDFFSYNRGINDIFNLQISCRDNFVHQSEVDQKVNLWIKESKLSFTDWIANSTHLSMTQPAFINNPSSSVLINSRHVIKTFVKWANPFTTMFRRRAFVHHFQALGMDQMQFVEAESNLNDIISQYTPCTAYDEEDFSYLGQSPQ